MECEKMRLLATSVHCCYVLPKNKLLDICVPLRSGAEMMPASVVALVTIRPVAISNESINHKMN